MSAEEPTDDEIAVALEELAANGQIRDSGKRRNGQVVWEAVLDAPPGRRRSLKTVAA